ncbi:MAG: MoxR family ATPase [Spirochaetales bacterium]|nr:MoxR family ATPase [Spirochaetales bacterium]
MKEEQVIEITREETVEWGDRIRKVLAEVSKGVVGQSDRVTEILVCLLSKGHALIEGVPGLGKTYLIKSLGKILGLQTTRIQFTPDLMPADIIGTHVIMKSGEGIQDIQFQKGPVFTQILLADEINRATPKTQSAMLEAMQEQQVTVGGKTYPLELPFIVLATQNPIEMEGTYPLPEAQLDRFFFKLRIEYPKTEEIGEILDRTTYRSEPELKQITDTTTLLRMQELVRGIPISREVQDYAIRILMATHPEKNRNEITRYIRYGASPRGAQSMVLSGKVFALIDGRYAVSFEDIRRAALPSLRHRIILSFEGEAEGITPEGIISSILEEVAEA